MITTNPLNIERLAKGITHDINTCEQLLALLKEEQNLLKERKLDSLEQLVNEKSHLLNQLHHSAVSRAQWIAHFNREKPAANQETEAAFSEIAEQLGLSEDWAALKSLFKACQDANEINGKTLARSHATHERLLNILRGQGNDQTLYTGKGAASKSQSGTRLGEA